MATAMVVVSAVGVFAPFAVGLVCAYSARSGIAVHRSTISSVLIFIATVLRKGVGLVYFCMFITYFFRGTGSVRCDVRV